MTDDNDATDDRTVSLSPKEWSQIAITLHVKKRDYDDESWLHGETERLVNEIGEQADISPADLERYRGALRDDPNVAYDGEADDE